MTEDSPNVIPPSGASNPSVRTRLRVVPTHEPADEGMSRPADPTTMGSQDIASLLRFGGQTELAAKAEDVSVRDLETPEAEGSVWAPALNGKLSIADPVEPNVVELAMFEPAYPDGTRIPAEAPEHSMLRRHRSSEAQADAELPGAAFDAATVGVWAARRGHEWNDNDVIATEAPAWDQTTTVPASPDDPDRTGRRSPPGWLVLAAVLTLLVAGGVVAVLGGGGGDANAAHTVKHHSSTPALTVTTPAHTRATAKPRVRKHHKEHHHRRAEIHKTVPSQTPVTTTAAPVSMAPVVTAPTTSNVPTHSTAVVLSTPPASGPSSTASTKTSSSSRGRSNKSSAGSGAVPTGGLPGIQETEQQP